jgi:hypothetical protein
MDVNPTNLLTIRILITLLNLLTLRTLPAILTLLTLRGLLTLLTRLTLLRRGVTAALREQLTAWGRGGP